MPTGFSSECMTCVLGKHARSIPEDWSEARRAAFLRSMMRLMADSDPSEDGPSVMRRANELAAASGIPPRDYSGEKARYNGLMLSLAPRLREEIQAAADPLARALQYARVANYIDFAALPNVSEAQLMSLLEGAADDPVDGGEYARLRADLAGAKRLAYLTDNCGEIVADRLLVERIHGMWPELGITVIVRGGDVANDANVEDALAVGMDAVAEVMGNGNALMGTFLKELSPEASARLREADVVISKGQANFETMAGCGLNVYYLFLCKCRRFERRLGIARMQGVLMNERRMGAQEDLP